MSAPCNHILRPGVYAPIVTPFVSDSSKRIDLDVFSSNVARLAKADVGLIVSGTLGEGPLLDREERNALTSCAKKTIRGLGLESRIPVITGVMGASVSECVALSKEAAEAGADAIIVVAPAYFAWVYKNDKSSVKAFFTSLADQSNLPVILYNIPFAAGGIDLDAPFLVDISEHPNIAGVKLTCMNNSKGHRVALHVNTSEYRERHPLPFLVLPGATDYLLPALISRQHGCMGGPANLYPKVCVKLYRTAVEALETGDFGLLREAQHLQDLVTEADSVINKVGFLGIKTAMNYHVDKTMSRAFRKPLPPAMDENGVEDIQIGLTKIMNFENSL